MRKWMALLLAAILLGGCAQSTEPAAISEQPEEPVAVEPEPPSVEKKYPAVVEMYFPFADMTPEEVVEAYFEETYWGYSNLVNVDLSAILDTEQTFIDSSITWSKKLIQRRRLLLENDLCYVEMEQYPYTIRYIEEADLRDTRMEFWSTRRPERKGDVTLHFEITGEEGRVYPPQLAVNTQHTMRLRRMDGQWKITFLYFPGSYRKYLRANNLEVPEDDEVLEALLEEFAETSDDSAQTGGTYDGMAAAEYARRYTERANTAFYHIGDWMGNCANFTSQSIWAGFLGDGDPAGLAGRACMTAGWYAGEGGGSPAWENVERFWQFLSSEAEMSGTFIEGVSGVQPGDLMQISSLVWAPDEDDEEGEPEDRYNHSVIVVDADTLLLAQNSPGCFVYYSDMPDVTTRIVRPHSLNG